MRPDFMHAWIWWSLRLLLFFLATCSGLLAIGLALTAIPETGRNPASSDFGWLRSEWLEGFVLATALVGLAIRVASGRTKMLFATLLLVIWVAGLVPGYQFCAYQVLPDLERMITKRLR
jgi:Co/Zn/Cd efflux system component